MIITLIRCGLKNSGPECAEKLISAGKDTAEKIASMSTEELKACGIVKLHHNKIKDFFGRCAQNNAHPLGILSRPGQFKFFVHSNPETQSSLLPNFVHKALPHVWKAVVAIMESNFASFESVEDIKNAFSDEGCFERLGVLYLSHKRALIQRREELNQDDKWNVLEY